jgi:hypothetical protein
LQRNGSCAICSVSAEKRFSGGYFRMKLYSTQGLIATMVSPSRHDRSDRRMKQQS